MEKDHVEILLEDIKEKFDLVLEGHQGLHREIREMRQDMNEHFELVNFKIDTLNKKIDGVDARLSKKIDGVEASLSKKIDGVEASLSKKIDGVEESLRKDINRVEQKVDNVAADLSAHRADTESHSKGYRISEP